jgi:hypothetical protein
MPESVDRAPSAAPAACDGSHRVTGPMEAACTAEVVVRVSANVRWLGPCSNEHARLALPEWERSRIGVMVRRPVAPHPRLRLWPGAPGRPIVPSSGISGPEPTSLLSPLTSTAQPASVRD